MPNISRYSEIDDAIDKEQSRTQKIQENLVHKSWKKWNHQIKKTKDLIFIFDIKQY